MTGAHEHARPSRLRQLLHAVLLAAAVLGVLQLLHSDVHERHELPALLHWLRDAALALPIALAAVLVADRVRTGPAARRPDLPAAALAGGGAFAALSVPGGMVHERLFVAEHTHSASFLEHSAMDGMTAWLLAATVLLGLSTVQTLQRSRSARSVRRPLAAALAVTLVAPVGAVGVAAVSAAPASAATPACAATRSYDVAVIDLDIPYNRWGTDAATGATNLDADGMMYVLQQDKAAVKNWHVPLARKADGSVDVEGDVAGGRRLRPRPLVLRSNVGECVKVTLKNELSGPQFGGELTNPRVSMHVHGAAFDVQTSDGSKVGFNADSTIGIGETKVYNLVAPAQEGAYLFHDHGANAGSEADGGATVHGLFGALAVEPAGSQWHDPVSGKRLDTATPYSEVAGQSGELYIDAMITPPGAKAFRESIQLGHDEIPGIGFGFNYGAEPGDRREDYGCADCVGEETSLSSWTFGDPALVKLASGKGPWLPSAGVDKVEDCGLRTKDATTGQFSGSCWTSNVTHAYAKDPIKFRYGLSGVKETHVFHMHAHQWLTEPHDNADVGTADDPNGNQQSMKVDSQTFGPGDMFTADLIGGAGSVPGTVGDSIFHCHLYPHFAEGFWSLFRVHDVHENGNGTTPDGIGVVALRPLPDRAQKPGPTETSPGFPRFIPGEAGWRAPQPYLGISEANGQADVADTVAREDLKQAKRMVAGRYLDETVLDKTQSVQSTSGGSGEVQEVSNTSAPVQEQQVISVDADGGTFTLGNGGTTTPQQLPYDATAQQVTDALAALGASAAAVQPDPAVRSWLVTFNEAGDKTALVVDGAALTKTVTTETTDTSVEPAVTTTTTSTVAGTVAVETSRPGGDGGTFTLAFDGGTASGALPFDASVEQVQEAVGTRATVSKPAAQRWTLTYSSPGDVTEPVVDGSGLTSGTASVSTTTPGTGASSFSLTFGSQTTGPLAHGATSAQVEAALEALSNVEDVTVTGTDPYVVSLVRWSRTDSLVLSATGATVTADPALFAANVDDTKKIAQVAHQLMVEKAALTAAHAAAGTRILPGAPMVDPCPSGARTVTYNVSVIQRDLVYNEAGWHDTQGRIYVLDKDVEAVMNGTKEPEPLFIRVNAGDCIDFNLTNYLPNWIGGDAFIELAQTNMVGGHIHLVKFDVMGSDGSSNGWNYQGAAFTKDQMDFNAQIAGNPSSCSPTLCRITAPNPAYSPVGSGPNGAQGARGQTIHERWYADSELRTVFTHDHHFPALVQNRGQYGALVVEPAGTQYRNPFDGTMYKPGTSCATSCVGDAFGTHMDILGPGANDDFREFGLSFQDFVSLTKKGGDPKLASDTFNPPAAPEHYPNEDPGVMGINYKNAPFLLRDSKNGAWVDPAYRFSSTVFGDPKTPLLQAYAGDKVRIRLIQGSQEEQNVWALHGMRWREEPDDPESPLVSAKALGISDAPNFEIPRMTCDGEEDCMGDYLYSSTSTDATYLGMWGIMRVHGKKTDKLLALPDNQITNTTGVINQTVTGTPPSMVPAGKKGGAICPSSAEVKKFDVFATDGKIVYNGAGDHDPYGLMYGVVQPGETPEQAVERVRKEQSPMVLRANEGQCLEVTLTNRIDPNGPFATQHAKTGTENTSAGGDPNLPLEPPTGTRAGLRVSLHPQVVRYDVRYSDGATVGFSKDQTVGPGQSILYRWWADDVTPGEIGATNLVDFGDVRGHRHHGLFAGLVIEPKGSTYHDPITGDEVTSGVQADIRVPDPAVKDFREHVPFFQDGLNLRDAAGKQIALPDHDGGAEVMDSEDEGEKAFNYRSPRFAHRGDPLHQLPGATGTTIDGRALADVFDSTKHGDPDTPVFRAYAGDPVRVRVLQGSDKPRQHSYQLSGHAWRSQAHDPGSSLMGTSGGFSVSRALDVHTTAGGLYGAAGDYRYNCGVSFHHQSGGLWGIERVYAAPPSGYFTPSTLGTGKDPATADNPRRAGYAPIQPLEQRTVAAVVFDDTNRNRLRGNDEKALPGVPVELRGANSDGTPGPLLATRPTDAAGRAVFTVPTGAYDLVVPAPADFAATTPTTMRVTASEDGTVQSAEFGQVQLANLALRPFNDANGNLVVDAGEVSMEGWSVSLTGEGKTATVTVTKGVAAFGDLLPGSYSATVTPGPGYYSTTHKSMPVAMTVLENDDLTGDKEFRVGYALKAGVSVQVFNDSNSNGTQELGESTLPGRSLTAKGGPEGSVVTTATTDAAGTAVLDDPDPAIEGLVPGAYDVTQALSSDWKLTKATRKVTKADGSLSAEQDLTVSGSTATTAVEEKTTQIITLRNHNPKGWVSAVPFNDLNNDGVRQDKEGKLVGWRASLHDSTGAFLAETTTDNGGKATWYVAKAGGVDAPVTYTVKMTPQEVAADEIPWTATTSGSATVKAVSGEDRSVGFGFVQLGTIQAMAWHDLDKDGEDSGRGEVLANRTVRLYDAGGKTLLQQKVTDGGGMASFKASAGIDYQLEVLLPTGWTATAPLAANGSPVTKVKVAGPTGLDSVLTRFGQYNTNDRTPPPDPTLSAAPGTNGAHTVTLSSESGATFRYTLDGSLPSQTSGMKYTGAVTIGAVTRTLTAVAIDAAGNVSQPVSETFTVTGGSTAGPVAPGTWTATTGTTRGALSDLAAADDGTRYFLTAASSGKSYVTDGYATYVVPTAQRKLLGLGVLVESRASIAGVTRSVELYNWSSRKYEVLRPSELLGTTDSRDVVDVSGDPLRFLDPKTGQLRLKVRGSASKPFEIGVDQLGFRLRHGS